MSKHSKMIILFAIIIPSSLLIPSLFQSNMSTSVVSQKFPLDIKINSPPILSLPVVNPITATFTDR